jgi:hypothetical protein
MKNLLLYAHSLIPATFTTSTTEADHLAAYLVA